MPRGPVAPRRSLGIAGLGYGQWWVFVNTVMNYCGSINCWKFLYQLVKQDAPPVRMSNTQYLAVSREYIS